MPPDTSRGPSIVVLASVTCAYLVTASRFVQGGDNGEFVTLMFERGAAHPPGYPLYLLYLRIWSWLPLDGAWAAAVATALLGVVSVAVLMRACRAWGVAPRTADLVAAAYAFSTSAWGLATHAEVFTMNAVLAGILLWLAAPEGPYRGLRRVAALGLVAGLGLSNHHSIVLLAPVGAWGVWRGAVESGRKAQALGLGASFLAAGLVPYLVLPLAGQPSEPGAWVWGDPTTFRGLVHHFVRADYGGVRLSGSDASPLPLGNLLHWLRYGSQAFFFVPFALGLVAAIAHLVRRPTDDLPRSAAIALSASWFLAGPLFIARFNIDPIGVGGHVVARFYLLPQLVMAVLTARAAESALRRANPRLEVGRSAVVAAVCLAGVSSLDVTVRAGGNGVQAFLTDCLQSAPPRAVVLGGGDMTLFGFLYLQRVEGARPDVVHVDPLMLHYPWYHARAERLLGFDLPDPEAGNIDTAELASAVFANDRPLVLTDLSAQNILSSHLTYPIGPVIRVLPRGERPPDPATLERMNLDLLAGFVPRSRRVLRDSWAEAATEAYQRPWLALAQAFEAAGLPDRARINRERARGLQRSPE